MTRERVWEKMTNEKLPHQRILYFDDDGRWISELIGEFIDLFAAKQKDYRQANEDQVADEWGVLAQFMKMNDKIKKLRRHLYEAEMINKLEKMGFDVSPREEDQPDPRDEFQFEGTREILMDLIGHAFLTLRYLDEREGGL